MSRRRGWGYTLMAPLRWLSEAFRLLVMVPYYETIHAIEQFGRWIVGGTGAKSFGGIALYYLLWLPLTIWHIAVSVWRWLIGSLSTWPQRMRLRDLATGLPAFIVAVPIILGFTLLNLDRNELTQMYYRGMNESLDAARKAKTSEEQQAEMKNAMFYARSLVRIDPDELMFRFNLAHLYIKSGDNARGMTMLQELAPRDKQGFPPAHFHMAKLLYESTWNHDTLRQVEAHLNRALTGNQSDKVDINEVHRWLGDIYRGNYNATTKNSTNMLGYSPQDSLDKAMEHYKAYKGSDSRVAFTLAGILVNDGKVADAKRVMEEVTRDLQQKVDFNGDDIPSRIELARAHSQILNFEDAINTLQQGRNRSPDVRLDRALANVLYQSSELTRLTSRSVPELAYKLLDQAYLLDGENSAIVARYVQGLCDKDPAERARAGKALEGLPSPAKERGITKFLLAFDADRRNLPQRAAELQREALATKAPEMPGLIAEVAHGVFITQNKGIAIPDATQLLNKALRLWPTHPDLLVAQALRYEQSTENAGSTSLLQKAVDEREKNVTLKLRVVQDTELYRRLSDSYARVGRADLAERYRLKAQSAAAKKDVPK